MKPLLRAPPFPGAAPGAAAVGVAAPPRDSSDIDSDRLRALAAAIVAHRVGGSFWGRAIVPPPDFATLIAADTVAEARTLAAQAAGDPATMLVLLPDATAREIDGVVVATGEIDPWPLLARTARLHADAAGEIALLALMAGIPVHCPRHGPLLPGTTAADAALARGAARRLFGPVSYRDPYSGAPMEAEDAVAQLGFWRETIEANRGVAAGAGIAAWKRREVAAMLWDGRPVPLRGFARARPAVAAAARGGGAVAVWPSRVPTGLGDAAARAAVPVWCVEDGFVRSVGLGSGLHPPLSIVLDRAGIHFDPAHPSDLETILAETDFTADLIARAERLAARIVQAGISKYAVGRAGAPPVPQDGRRVVLVPGQVEDDLSVRRGGGAVAGNLDLLRRVRAAEPDARLLFKPHPDVLAGHRKGHVPDADALAFADAIVRDTPMAALFDRVDAVHVLTSLAGFEALLRGREVVTHGGPFYAGWGLTRDLAGPYPRRTRRLTLPELVAGAMILYPRYLDPVTMLPCPPEILLDRLTAQAMPAPTLLTRLRAWQGRLRGPRRMVRSAA
ncbi:MAG: beta-3-deoxy-D-manno-oct-2-ulosonic acid transferase [Sphingomonas sp.]